MTPAANGASRLLLHVLLLCVVAQLAFRPAHRQSRIAAQPLESRPSSALDVKAFLPIVADAVRIAEREEAMRVVGRFDDVDGGAWGLEVDGAYAYLGQLDRETGHRMMAVIDVSDPSTPRRVGRVSDLGGIAFSLEVVGAYVFSAAGSAGLVVIDVSDPTLPRVVSTLDLELDAFDVEVRGPLAFVLEFEVDGSYSSDTFVLIADVSEATQPVQLARLPVSGNAHSLAIAADSSGRAVYVGDSYLDELLVIDVRDATRPEVQSRLPMPGVRDLKVTGDRLLIASTPNGRDDDNVRILDISEPLRPHELGALTIGQTYIVAGEGSYAYSFTGSGLVAIDISRPLDAHVVAQADVTGLGVLWAVRPSGNLVYLSSHGGEPEDELVILERGPP